jgi:hypothetical protein
MSSGHMVQDERWFSVIDIADLSQHSKSRRVGFRKGTTDLSLTRKGSDPLLMLMWICRQDTLIHVTFMDSLCACTWVLIAR